MSDIVERLSAVVPRKLEWVMRDYPDGRTEGPFDPLRLEAAAEITALRSRAEAAEALLTEARAVLEPFARDARELAEAIPDDTAFAMEGFDELGLADFTVGDLRAAAALVKKMEKADG